MKDKVSKKTDCKYIVTLDALNPANITGRWKATLGASEGSHNHPGVEVSGLANHRRSGRVEDMKAFLLSARRDGASTKVARAMTVTRFYSGLTTKQARLVLRDIYNEWARIRSINLNSHTPVDRVLECLHDDNFFVRHTEDQDKRLESVSFAHPDLVSIYKDNGDILVINCTYSVVKYKLPLLCFIGITRLV